MISFDELESMKLYRGIVYLPMDAEMKDKNHLIYLNTTSVDGSIDIMNNTLLKNRNRYKGYFYNPIYKFKLFNKPVNIKQLEEQTQNYVNVKESCQLIQKTFKNIVQYKGFNTFYDLSMINKIYGDLKRPSNYNLSIDSYISLIGDIDATVATDFPKRYMLMDLQELAVEFKDTDTYKKTSVDNCFEVYMNLLRFRFDTFKSLPYKLMIRNGNYTVKVDPSLTDKNSYAKLKAIIMKMKQLTIEEETGVKEEEFNTVKPQSKIGFVNSSSLNKKEEKVDVTEISNKDIEKNDIAQVSSAVIVSKLNGTDTKLVSSDAPKEETKVANMIEKEVGKLVDEGKINKEESIDKINDKVEDALQQNDEFMQTFEMAKMNRISGIMSPGNLARNRQLAEKQAKIQYQGKTIKQIIEESKDEILEPKILKADVINKSITENKVMSLDETYNKKQYDNDIIGIINFFKEKSIPVYVLDIKKEDTSTAFDKKFTWTVKLESADRQRHSLVFDVPKIIDNSYLYLGGNKKDVYKQLFLLPVSKTAPDTVQVCTNYNKVFISRVGEKISPKLERIKKIIPSLDRKTFHIVTGNNSKPNMAYKTQMEYDEIAKNVVMIEIKGNETIFFNQNYIRDYAKNSNIKLIDDMDMLPIAVETKSNKVKYLNLKTDKVEGTNLSFGDWFIEEINQFDKEFKQKVLDSSVGKRFMYSEATLVAKKIPLIYLLSYLEGLTRVLKKANINHTFSDTRPMLKDNDKNDKGIVEFKDGFLMYDKYPLSNSLLLNAMNLIPTKNYNYADFDSKETYLDVFDQLIGVKMIANALDNYYDLLLDSITLDVLKDNALPTDFVELFVYANTLLEDNAMNKQTNLQTCRIRSNEIISAMVYKELATAYEGYRITAGNKNPRKMSIPQDQILKKLVMLNTVEDYSTLNPVLEAEKLRAVSFKGMSGMNLDRAFTLDMRAYDKSMLGILSISSPPSGAVGIVRQLPLDSNIKSIRGYLDIAQTPDSASLKASNLFSPAELLIPGASTHDDAPRIAMAATQYKHVVPCNKYDKLLIGNGSDKVLAQTISNDFAFKAKEDGKVEELNEQDGVMILKYKNGEFDIVNLRDQINKNGGK